MKLIINDNIIKCKVCNTPETIKNGMMGKTFDSFDGMFFMLPNKTNQNFWMYNCLVPSDIIIIDDNHITKIHHNCQPCENEYDCTYYSGFGNRVLELPGGTCNNLGIKENDSIKMSLH
jgi:uncharacterized membrane protein (UPF0127 family)